MPATLTSKAEAYVVLRPFTALGRTMERGEVIDPTDWRNIQPLVNTRYLAPAWAPEARFAFDEADEIPATPAMDQSPIVERRRPGRPRKVTEDSEI